jgi:hypothetical protein
VVQDTHKLVYSGQKKTAVTTNLSNLSSYHVACRLITCLRKPFYYFSIFPCSSFIDEMICHVSWDCGLNGSPSFDNDWIYQRGVIIAEERRVW